MKRGKMNTEEKYKLHKGFYEFEFQRKNFINTRLTSAYTVIIIIGGAGAYFLNNLELFSIGLIEIIFFLLFVPFAVSLLCTFRYLIKCSFTYEYGYLAEAKEFQSFIEKHEKRNKHVAEDKKRNIRDTVQQSLSKDYCECATILRHHNKTRNLLFLKAMKATYIAIIFLFTMTPVFYAQKYQNQLKRIFNNDISVQQIKESKAMCDKDEDMEPKEPEIDRVMEYHMEKEIAPEEVEVEGSNEESNEESNEDK